MTDTRLDVLCIGNAIVDIIADCDDAFLEREGLTKGMMRLIDADEATRLYDHMGPAREISGGSAGNTAVTPPPQLRPEPRNEVIEPRVILAPEPSPPREITRPRPRPEPDDVPPPEDLGPDDDDGGKPEE